MALKKKVLLFIIEAKKARQTGEIQLQQQPTMLKFFGSKLAVGHQAHLALYELSPLPDPEVVSTILFGP